MLFHATIIKIVYCFLACFISFYKLFTNFTVCLIFTLVKFLWKTLAKKLEIKGKAWG